MVPSICKIKARDELQFPKGPTRVRRLKEAVEELELSEANCACKLGQNKSNLTDRLIDRFYFNWTIWKTV